MRKILFLGNGINRLTKGFSWKQLLINLYDKIGITKYLGDNVPLPFVFEYIYHMGYKSNLNDSNFEKLLKETVIKMIDNVKPNTYHFMLNKTSYTDIITTNYDYNQDRGFLNQDSTLSYWMTKYGATDEKEDFLTRSKFGKKREIIYRLYTYTSKDKRKVWHIHGELDYPKTIVLGYESYLKAISRIDSHITKNSKKESWINLLMNYDVDIIGYNLDYNENTIWYVLNTRARDITEGKKNNKITYHILKKDSNENLNRILKSFFINVEEYEYNNYEQMYEDLFNENTI